MKYANSKVPQIRFKGFEGVWEDQSLGNLFPITSAARVHKHEWTKSGVPFFRSSDVVSAFKSKENTKAFISHDLYLDLSEKVGRVKKGDMLVTGGGSIGIPYLVKTDDPLYFKDADLLWFKIRDSVDSHYLFTFFSSQPFERYVKSISHIGTIAHYTVEQAKLTPLAVPRITAEQTQIGTYFRELDRLIELNQRKYDKLLTLKKAMLQKMFPQSGATTPEIRFKGFSGEWVEKDLRELCEIVGGGTPSTMIREYWGGDIDWYSPTEIGDDVYAIGSTKKITQLGLTKCSARMLPSNKTILFTSRAGIGDMAILTKEGCTNQGFQSLVLYDDIDPYFIFSMGHLIKIHALKNASGSTFLEISSKQLGKMKILLPKEKEQKKIGSYFRTLDELISKNAIQLKKLKQIKSACLEKMFV
ncbi:restriction endonuclease subunit S [Janthinobacterium sp. Ant5-2-1]|uniref:restriction endonuclease subunit S n=1 Tax=Janthinobacterium sp. Ant5-2-1 TaxID=1755239 RepID=UPI0009E9557A|nr:restriction endonuclease subunit S [Janthinobacterium sp. Ant5-2-1]